MPSACTPTCRPPRSRCRTTLAGALAQLENAERKVALLRDTYLPLSTETRDQVRAAYLRGAQSLLEFLDAERVYRQTTINHINALAAYETAIYQLEAAVGGQVPGGVAMIRPALGLLTLALLATPAAAQTKNSSTAYGGLQSGFGSSALPTMGAAPAPAPGFNTYGWNYAKGGGYGSSFSPTGGYGAAAGPSYNTGAGPATQDDPELRRRLRRLERRELQSRLAVERRRLEPRPGHQPEQLDRAQRALICAGRRVAPIIADPLSR